MLQILSYPRLHWPGTQPSPVESAFPAARSPLQVTTECMVQCLNCMSFPAYAWCPSDLFFLRNPERCLETLPHSALPIGQLKRVTSLAREMRLLSQEDTTKTIFTFPVSPPDCPDNHNRLGAGPLSRPPLVPSPSVSDRLGLGGHKNSPSLLSQRLSFEPGDT